MQAPSQNQRAHMALLATAFIWGINYAISKYLLTGLFTPLQLIFLRLSGGMICFYIFQKLFVNEKVASPFARALPRSEIHFQQRGTMIGMLRLRQDRSP